MPFLEIWKQWHFKSVLAYISGKHLSEYSVRCSLEYLKDRFYPLLHLPQSSHLFQQSLIISLPSWTSGSTHSSTVFFLRVVLSEYGAKQTLKYNQASFFLLTSLYPDIYLLRLESSHLLDIDFAHWQLFVEKPAQVSWTLWWFLSGFTVHVFHSHHCSTTKQRFTAFDEKNRFWGNINLYQNLKDTSFNGTSMLHQALTLE